MNTSTNSHGHLSSCSIDIGKGLSRDEIKEILIKDPGAWTLETVTMLDQCLMVHTILHKAQEFLDLIKPDHFLFLCTEHVKVYENLLERPPASHQGIKSQIFPFIQGELNYIFHKTKQNEDTLRLTTCSVVKDLRVVW